MDKENIKGAAQKIKGKIEEVAGKVLGDKDLELQGKPTSSAAPCAMRWEPREIQ